MMSVTIFVYSIVVTNKYVIRKDLSTISIWFTILELSLKDSHCSSFSPLFNPYTHSIRLSISTQLSDVIVITTILLQLLVLDRSIKIDGNSFTLQQCNRHSRLLSPMLENMLGDREGCSWFFEKEGIKWGGYLDATALFLLLLY